MKPEISLNLNDILCILLSLKPMGREDEFTPRQWKSLVSIYKSALQERNPGKERQILERFHSILD
jgi:hypothetical protein